MSQSLSLRPIVDVEVNLSQKAATRKGFNLALAITTETPTGWGSTEILRKYTGYEGVAIEFGSDSDAAKAAQLYFSQRPTPRRLAIGLQKAAVTPKGAFLACREVDSEWYAFTFLAIPTDAEALEVAEAVEPAQPTTAYMQTLNSSAILSDPGTSLPATLQRKAIRRTHTHYSTKSPYAVLAITGYAMAANNGTTNSAFTLKFKQQVGIETEDLSQNQVETLQSLNCNVYILRAEYYSWYENGVQADGTSFDELIFLDQFANDCQLSIADGLNTYPKIPQTDSGISRLIQFIQEPCEELIRIGFIAPGVWKGQDILSLVYGNSLTKGYLIQAESVDTQSQADREARKAPPIYIALKLAGAVEFVIIRVNVNR